MPAGKGTIGPGTGFGESAMPVHDWSRVSAGTFHDFHNAWITELRNALNGGLLPPGYYAQGEQHAGQVHTDVLTLHAGGEPVSPGESGLAVLEKSPPRVSRRVAASEAAAARATRRTLIIRHASGHRVVASWRSCRRLTRIASAVSPIRGQGGFGIAPGDSPAGRRSVAAGALRSARDPRAYLGRLRR